jgi:nucleotide-binding universal stress UspA family protein
MFKKIAVGYARDQAGRDAAVLADQLAKLGESELEVVFPYHPLFATESPLEIERSVRTELHKLLGNSAALARAHFRSSSSSWPIHALHELAEEENAETIVVGATPSASERHHVSRLERLVHSAPCTVALAPASFSSHPFELRAIGVGFADTPEGRAALILAREIAECAGATVRVLAATGFSRELPSYVAPSPQLPLAETKMQRELHEVARHVTTELLAGVDYEVEVCRGDPCELLVRESETLDMLVLGSRAYGPLRRVLLGSVSLGSVSLGSVSASVMRASRCPVIVAPRGARVEATDNARRSAAAQA